jgi:hypothetical protein
MPLGEPKSAPIQPASRSSIIPPPQQETTTMPDNNGRHIPDADPSRPAADPLDEAEAIRSMLAIS